VRRLVAALLLISVGCASIPQPAAAPHTLPEPVSETELPPSPDATPIPPEDNWAVPIDDVEVSPGDHRSGILFSIEKAQRVALLRIAYDELRGLYDVDLRTWGREREIYERQLGLADQEVTTWRTRAQRSWWEENGDEFSLFLGLGLGIVLSVAVGAIIAELR